MGKIKLRLGLMLGAACFALSALVGVALPVTASADGDTAPSAFNEKLVVKYNLDETSTGNGAKLTAYKWDSDAQEFVVDANAAATVQNTVQNKRAGTVSSTSGIDGTALQFTGSAHARANFRLPTGATGMTVSMWVKDVNSYWSSLVEFWNGTDGGRFGKGTMQGNGGRRNEGDAWSANCPAHSSATIAAGGGWDSFVIKVNSNDNGGAAVDPMVADTWYQVTYALTATELRAYRNGELKQTFDGGNSGDILASIMRAVTSNNGKLGIRLGLDENDGDILDDFRIYNGAMSTAEVQSLYAEYKVDYDKVIDLISVAPEYYEIEGVGYPDLLLGGATSVSDGAGGTKTGITETGVTYSYTPVSGTATTAKDNTGVAVTLSKNGIERTVTVKFLRRLNLKAESLGYRLGEGELIPIEVPEDPNEDIIVKVAAGSDLSNVEVQATVKQFEEDSNAQHYTSSSTYSASTHTALVRCSYSAYAGYDTLYTVKFVEKSTTPFDTMTVTGGMTALQLTQASFQENTASVAVENVSSFTLNVSIASASGAQLAGGETELTLTQSNLVGGKLAITVVNENGGSTVYYLVPVAATLSAISIAPYELSFAAGTTEYTVTVGTGEGVKVYDALTATATDTNATVSKRYDRTENTITLTVTAADGVTVQTYVIKINELDNDATLSKIEVGGIEIADFDPEKTDYTVKYAGELPAVTVKATSTAALAPSVGAADANGKVTITVTAENGATKEYTVTLVKISNDASLKKLLLNGTEITLTGNTAEYRAPLGTRLEALIVTAETADGASAVSDVDKDGSKIVITVTAEDGTTATYTVNVNITADADEGGVTEDNSPKPESSLNGGAIAGIVIAAVAVAAGIAVGAWLIVRMMKKKAVSGNKEEGENRDE
ncbi:MAG: hypothetical protein K2L87_04140 [Clostridiales bacterium]|nr:hypothetical protein [Clostridiales bacterium]